MSAVEPVAQMAGAPDEGPDGGVDPTVVGHAAAMEWIGLAAMLLVVFVALPLTVLALQTR